MKSIGYAFSLWLGLFFLAPLARADVYVVTSASNNQKVTLEQVKDIYTLTTSKWPDGKVVVYSLPEFDSLEGAMMLEKVYGYSKDKVKKLWLGKVFRGDVPAMPETKSGAAVKEFLAAHPNGIGILQGSDADSKVTRLLKLD